MSHWWWLMGPIRDWNVNGTVMMPTAERDAGGRATADCECLLEKRLAWDLGGFFVVVVFFSVVEWRRSWLQILLHFELNCVSYSFGNFIYSVDLITAALRSMKSKKNPGCSREISAVIFLHSYSIWKLIGLW